MSRGNSCSSITNLAVILILLSSFRLSSIHLRQINTNTRTDCGYHPLNSCPVIKTLNLIIRWAVPVSFSHFLRHRRPLFCPLSDSRWIPIHFRTYVYIPTLCLRKISRLTRKEWSKVHDRQWNRESHSPSIMRGSGQGEGRTRRKKTRHSLLFNKSPRTFIPARSTG